MGIARRGGSFLMTEKGTNDRQRHAASSADRSEGVAQIVNAEIAEIGRFADRDPRLSQVHQCRTLLTAHDDMRVALDTGQFLQKLKRGWR